MLIFLKCILWIFRFFTGACIFHFMNIISDHFLTLQRKGGRGKMDVQVRNFVVDISGGAAFIGCAMHYGCGAFGILSLKGIILLIYIGLLIIVARIDWESRIIYDRFHIMILILAIMNIWLFREQSIKSSLIGAVIIAGPMLILAIIIPGAFGGGDIKLMAVSGLFLGTTSIICAMVLGLFTGGVYSALMLKCGKLSRKDSFAFGPFLAIGLAAAAFYGDQIVSWYLHFMA